MKPPSSLFTNTITVIGAFFYYFNLKKEWFDPMWNTFFVIQILFLNAVELQKNIKNYKNNKQK
ncbi:MAG: hypothetical protein HC854_14670 [Flavobacterium sp.]|nr:hypothetical protein [Flavobacterium sp.]